MSRFILSIAASLILSVPAFALVSITCTALNSTYKVTILDYELPGFKIKGMVHQGVEPYQLVASYDLTGDAGAYVDSESHGKKFRFVAKDSESSIQVTFNRMGLTQHLTDQHLVCDDP